MAKCSGCTAATCICALLPLDTATLNLTITGTGAPEDPWIISGETAGDAVVEDLATFTRTGDVSVTTGVARFKFPFAATLINVTAAVNTAPTGADIILDIHKNGTTIFTTQANRPRILAGTFQETVDAVPDVTSVANDQYLTVDIDQIGSVVAGAELTVFVLYSRP